MRFLASLIMQGRMQAIACAATSLLLSLLFPPFSLLAAAVIALVTLRLGWREGLNTLLAAALASGLLGAIVLGNFWFPAGYGLLLWLPIWAVALLLRLSRDLGLTLEVTAWVGVMGVVLVYLIVPDPAGFWQQRIQAGFSALWSQTGADPALWQAQLSMISRYMTGIMAAGMVSSVALSLLWGRWWQALLFNPGGFRREFLHLRPRRTTAWLTLGLLSLTLVTDGSWRAAFANMLLVLFVLYVTVGVAVLHAVFAAHGRKAWLYVLYGLMLFIPHVFAPIALVGLSDAWFDWRGRYLPFDEQSD